MKCFALNELIMSFEKALHDCYDPREALEISSTYSCFGSIDLFCVAFGVSQNTAFDVRDRNYSMF
jgi:hypothetical protein